MKELGVKYAFHLQLVEKRVVDFLFAIIEHFSHTPTVETLSADFGQIRRFSKGVGHFKRIFQVEGDIAHQPLLVPEKIE